jgi:undecaprenyl diphosphate synthase
MDGNGRWSARRNLPRLKGHEEGAESVVSAVRACRDAGVEFLTLYAFSTQNWKRPKTEVEGLMRLLQRFLREKESQLHENRVRLRVIGRTADLPARVRKELDRVMASTREYTEGTVVFALSYGGRTEIVDAARRIAQQVRDRELEPDQIDEDTISGNLYAPDIPDPDLLIRTSGEMRISNFLLWQISYAELYVTDVLWPDFREEEFKKALADYACRERRFGGRR